ncbi:hypothetical protein OPAG_08373 [Rhodococcus opacus PD630]|uniref:hypothetical protein n=1 Tax=Rhodococcus opacus TaxID=37919 RepID=UPI00029CBBA5|nr:hypothetical protein [Rhodococcus opacus]AHK35504.1 hypothetical protein Pd630_LPD10054 [Rhodococcus opacus PD630]EHI39083.1 hypothetical protein OPAG_08373 [Rhodococcus opacus PD630]UDH01756.1 hypothetical protein K2Z90_008216 [Rhodococcus opacus PD630]
MTLGTRSILLIASTVFATAVGALVALSWDGVGESASASKLISPWDVGLSQWHAGLIAAAVAFAAFTIATIVATRKVRDHQSREVAERDPLLRLAAAALEDDARHQVNPTGRGKL